MNCDLPTPKLTEQSPVPRVIPFDGASNFRELGGYPAADGRHVKCGLFYRGGTLHDLQSESDRALLESLGLKLVLDFRSAGERQVSPDHLPGSARYCPVSAMRYANGDEVDFSPAGMARLEEEFTGFRDMSVMEYLSSYYRRMPFNNPAFEAVFRAMEQGEVPMLFHCTSGKDRTGVAAMLILLALGADRETALKDYMETNRCREAEIELLRKTRGELVRSDPEEWDLLMIQLGVLRKLAEASLDAIGERYDSMEQYFDAQFGLNSERLEALRDRYLE